MDTIVIGYDGSESADRALLRVLVGPVSGARAEQVSASDAPANAHGDFGRVLPPASS